MQFVIFLYLSKKSTKLKADEPEKTKIFIMKTTKPDLEKHTRIRHPIQNK